MHSVSPGGRVSLYRSVAQPKQRVQGVRMRISSSGMAVLRKLKRLR